MMRVLPRASLWGLAAARRLCTAAAKKHVQMEVTPSGVAILRLDCQGEKQNTLSEALVVHAARCDDDALPAQHFAITPCLPRVPCACLTSTLASLCQDDFDACLTRFEEDATIKAAVLISGKKDSWVAGANIKMIEKLTDATAATEAARTGQSAFDRIADFQSKKPMVAAIDGACLGGGLELALACGYRMATSSPKTVLGVPEVMIGLLPGSGGTQRLPRLIGAAAALDLMLTGKQLKADRAKKLGLVDAVVDSHALERSAIATAEQLATGALKPRARKLGWMDWALEKTALGRKVLFDQAEKKVTKQTKGRYPAPYAILECTRTGLESGHAVGSKVERERFGELAVTSEARALRGLFFGQTDAKKNLCAAHGSRLRPRPRAPPAPCRASLARLPTP